MASTKPSAAQFACLGADLAPLAARAFGLVHERGASAEEFDALMASRDAMDDTLFSVFVAVFFQDPDAEAKLPSSLLAHGAHGTFIPPATVLSLAHRSVTRSLVTNAILKAPKSCKGLAFSLAAPREATGAAAAQAASQVGHLSPAFVGLDGGLAGFIDLLNNLRTSFLELDEATRSDIRKEDRISRRAAAIARAALLHLEARFAPAAFSNLTSHIKSFIMGSGPVDVLDEESLRQWLEPKTVSTPSKPAEVSVSVLHALATLGNSPTRAPKRQAPEDDASAPAAGSASAASADEASSAPASRRSKRSQGAAKRTG